MSTATIHVATRTITVTSAASPGRPGVSWDNSGWEAGRTYLPDAGLFHNGSSWRAILAHDSTAATEPGEGPDWQTAWQVLAEKGGTGEQGDKGDPGEKGDTGERGPAGNDAAWQVLTQAEYDALTPDPNCLYVVIG